MAKFGAWPLSALVIGMTVVTLAGCGGASSASTASKPASSGAAAATGSSARVVTIACGSACQDAGGGGGGEPAPSLIQIDATGTVKSNGYVVPLRIGCGDSVPCQGRLLLSDRAAPCITVTGPLPPCLGSFEVYLPANSTHTFSLPLSAAGQAGLRQAKRLQILWTATQNGRNPLTGNFTLTLSG